MGWFTDLIWTNSVAHTILLLSLVIALGVMLGHTKIFGISLGMTMILFVGIFFGHLGLTIEPEILHFMKEFGLILFVYAIGLQVGPGFRSSLRKGGITLNLLATAIVVLGMVTTIILHYATGLSMNTMVGILSGAVTNTPGLGAAQSASASITGTVDPTIALGYAVAYPLGVIGIILSISLMKIFFKIRLEDENKQVEEQENDEKFGVFVYSMQITNPHLFNKSLADIKDLINRKFVISRILRDGNLVEIPTDKSVLHENDIVRLITSSPDKEAIVAILGKEVDMSIEEWNNLDSQLVLQKMIITRNRINGKRLKDLHLREQFDVTVTRISRLGMDLVASPDLALKVGDAITVVGTKGSMSGVEKLLGNKMKSLNTPNLIPIFIGIVLGIILGSIPVYIPGIPQPIKLGLAGGPLIVAILVSIFGPKFKLVTYTTMSANLMIREIGISLFLACVGIGAGEGFVDTIVNGGGWQWIIWGFIITIFPLLIVGFIGRKFFHLNYFTLSGLLAGSTTDPPALSYASSLTHLDKPAISYATVYPLTMFLRVMGAQLLILFFL